MLELLFRIAADNAPLKATVAESETVVAAGTAAINSQVASSTAAAGAAARDTLATSLKAQGASVEQAVAQYEKLGMVGRAAAGEIAQAYGMVREAAVQAGSAATIVVEGTERETAAVQRLATQQAAVGAAAKAAASEISAAGLVGAESLAGVSVQARAAQVGLAAMGESATSAGAATAAAATASAESVNATAAAMSRTIAQSLQQQGASAAETTQIYKQMGLSQAQASVEIAAAYGVAGQAARGAAAEAAGVGAAATEATGATVAGNQQAAASYAELIVRQAALKTALAAAVKEAATMQTVGGPAYQAAVAEVARLNAQLVLTRKEMVAVAETGAAATAKATESAAASYAELTIRQAALRAALSAATKEAVTMQSQGGPAYVAARAEVARLTAQLALTQEQAVLLSKVMAESGAASAEAAAAGAAALNGTLTPALARAGNETKMAHGSLILLERQLGIHLPRGVTSMIAHSELLGSILQKVFTVTILVYFAQEIDHIREKIADAALAFGGFGEKARKSVEEAIEANNKALVSFKDVKTGVDLSAEVNRNAAAIERQRAELEKSGGIAREWLDTLRQIFAPTITNQLATYERGLKAVGEAQAENTKRGIETGTQLAKVTLEQARYNLEVLRAKDVALAAGKERSDQLKVELRELESERALELRTATGNADKIAKVEEVYRWKRVELEAKITKALYEEAAKQHKPLVEALEKYNDMLGRLQSQYDSGTAAVRRYLETERHLAEVEQFGIDVWLARKINIQLLERERAEAVARATEEVTRAIESQQPPMLAWLANATAAAAAQFKLSDAERALLPLLGDHTNALQRMLDNSRAVVRNMDEEEMPARQRINAQIDRQISAADRELLRYKEQYREKKITLAEYEAAVEQHTAVVNSLEEQRERGVERETNVMKRAALQQAQALRQIRQELASTVVSFRNLEAFGGEALMSLSEGMGRSIADAIVYQKSIGDAMLAALKSTLASISAQAMVRAIEATALGFLLLAEQDYEGAANAFVSAGLWASIGGVAAIAGRAIPGGETTAAGRGTTSGAGQSAAAGGGPPELAAGAASAAGAPQNAPPPAQTIIYLTVEGDYLALPQAQDKLVGYIDEAVTKRDRILHSTHTLRPPPAGR